MAYQIHHCISRWGKGMYDLCPLIFNYYLFDFLNPWLSSRFPLILSTFKGFSRPYLYRVQCIRGKEGTDHDEEEGHQLKHISGPCQFVLLKQIICEKYIYKQLLNGIGRECPPTPLLWCLWVLGMGEDNGPRMVARLAGSQHLLLWLMDHCSGSVRHCSHFRLLILGFAVHFINRYQRGLQMIFV